MGKGLDAKKRLIDQVIAAVPASDYVGEMGGKYYFWSMEDGQKIQVCISMTCPKVPLETVPTMKNGGYDFSDETGPSLATPVTKPAEITDEERANINKLMKELGLK